MTGLPGVHLHPGWGQSALTSIVGDGTPFARRRNAFKTAPVPRASGGAWTAAPEPGVSRCRRR